MRHHPGRLSKNIFLLLLLSTTSFAHVALAQSPPSPTTPQQEGRTRPVETAGYPALAWRFRSGSQITDTPVVAGDTLLVHSEDGYLYALDQSTGEERWRLETGHAKFLRAEFVVAAGTVFVADATGHLLAVDLATGHEAWRRTVAPSEENQIFSPPTVLDGVVYVDDIEGDFGNVYALDAATGGVIWEARVGRMPAYALPVVDGAVVVADIDGYVWLLDAATGEHRWTYDTGNLVGTPPRVGDGAVYIGVVAGEVDAIDLGSGEGRWSTVLPFVTEQPPTVWGSSGGVLIVGVEDRLFGIDTEDGAIAWRFGSSDYPIPTIADGTVYALDANDRLTAFDAASGAPAWSVGHRVSELGVGDGVLYANVGQSVYALDRATGEERWRLRTGAFVQDPAAVSGNAIYVGSGDHFLYAIDRQRVPEAPAGFAGPPSEAQDESLLTVRLEPLPAAPAFAGIWRVTLPAGERGSLPPFAGPAAALVRGGALSSPGLLKVAVGPESSNEAETVEEGQSLFLPVGEPLELENEGDTTVNLLVVGILPGDARLPDAGRRDLDLALLGGALVEPLPGEGAFVDLRRLAVDPGAMLLPTLSVWPDVLAVEEGSVAVAAGEDPTITTVEAPDSAALGVGMTRFVRAGDGDPSLLLLLEVDGDVHIGQGAGCGGRCLTPR